VLKLDDVSNAWRVVHSEGDGLSGLVVDRYDDLLVVEFFSAGMFRHREWIYAALREHFPGCRFHSFADEHVQKQESFDYRGHSPGHASRRSSPSTASSSAPTRPARTRPASSPTSARTANGCRSQVRRQARARPVLQHRRLRRVRGGARCGRGGRHRHRRGGDRDRQGQRPAQQRAVKPKPRFVQADIFPWLRDAANRGEQFDVVILDPAKMTRDRDQVITALKKYLDMNKLALGVVKPGGLFATFSCTGLVSEDQFLDMLRRAAFYAGRTVQVLKVAGAGPDHPFLAHVQESRYLKAVFCRVLD
jgi:23S rRNA (cytosine1962-C5)-methyltransferase